VGKEAVQDMSSEKMWYGMMTGIFLVVSAAIVISFFTDTERTWDFPRHVFLLGLGFGAWAVFEWTRGKERYPYAYLVTLCSLFAFLIVILTLFRG
jgi:inner membrane protein involved in colicin E2 resistance